MGLTTKTRVLGTTATLKAKKAEDHILLARGLSARYCGANTPLIGLTADEMERDLRHMEAYANACTAYAQQYYIYQNKSENNQNNQLNNATSSNASGATNEAGDKPKAPNGGANSNSSSTSTQQQQPQPLIAMPVRIDPEEEKRLMTLRQKIQQCEGQREVLESQYLSLRAHYVYLSQQLKTFRVTVNGHAEFLQGLLQKRAKLVALQRARLQMAREVLTCLHYRQTAKCLEDDNDKDKDMDDNDNDNDNGKDVNRKEEDDDDLVEVWNQVEEQFKKAEQVCQKGGGGGTVEWHAIKIPTIPPGVPLYVSQLSKAPGFAAAWGTSSMFGSKPDSLCWIESSLRSKESHATHGKELPALRDEVDFLQRELGRERTMNKDLQTNIISRRKRNDELVAMMALLRTETEAVVARHNILLESDQAKDAAYKLHQEEEFHRGDINLNYNVNDENENSNSNNDNNIESSENNNINDINSNDINSNNINSNIVDETPPTITEEVAPQEAAVVKEDGEMTEGEEGEVKSSEQPPSLVLTTEPPNTTTPTNDLAAVVVAATSRLVSKVEDNENDGDDEGEEDDDEEGEILEGGEGDGSSKRSLEAPPSTGENGSPRTKRRKV